MRNVARVALASASWVCATIVSQPSADACSWAETWGSPHVVDSSLVGVDSTAPVLPQPVVVRIARHDGTGCLSGDSCGDFTSVGLTNFATDDQTPAAEIGYRVSVAAGALPSGLVLPGAVVHLPLPDGSLWLHWSGIDADVDVTLRFVAVDAAGNESAPQTVRIHDELGGCSVGRRAPAGAGVFGLVAVALATALRRRRSRTLPF